MRTIIGEFNKFCLMYETNKGPKVQNFPIEIRVIVITKYNQERDI